MEGESFLVHKKGMIKISYSALKEIVCPFYFYKKNFEGEKIMKPNASLLLGKALHDAICSYLQAKREDLDFFTELFENFFRCRWLEEKREDEEIKPGYSQTLFIGFHLLKQLFSFFRETRIFNEKYLCEYTVSRVFDKDSLLVGKIDLLFLENKKKGFWDFKLKTGDKTQLLFYHYTLNSFDVPSSFFSLKDRKLYRFSFTKEDIINLERRILNFKEEVYNIISGKIIKRKGLICSFCRLNCR